MSKVSLEVIDYCKKCGDSIAFKCPYCKSAENGACTECLNTKQIDEPCQCAELSPPTEPAEMHGLRFDGSAEDVNFEILVKLKNRKISPIQVTEYWCERCKRAEDRLKPATEIRLLREVQRADDLYIAAMIAGDNESKLVFADGWKVARAALAEFEKGKKHERR